MKRLEIKRRKLLSRKITQFGFINTPAGAYSLLLPGFMITLIKKDNPNYLKEEK